jgi:hypothetical protein
MAAEYKNADLNKIARDAERDLSSEANVKGHSTSDSARESGVDEAVTNKFPGSTVQYGSEATGRKIPLSEGGDINPVTGQYVAPFLHVHPIQTHLYCPLMEFDS